MKNKSTFSYLSFYIGNAKYKLIVVFICALAAGLCNITTPFIIGDIIDSVAMGNINFLLLAQTLAVLAAFYLGYIVLNYVMQYMSALIAQRVVERIRQDAFKKLNRLPLKYIDSNKHGDIISRFVNDCDLVAEGLLQGINQLFSGIIAIVGTLIFMLLISPVVTLAVVVMSGFSFVVCYFITRKINREFRRQQVLLGNITGLAEEYVQSIKTLKAYCYEDIAAQKVDKVSYQLFKVGKTANFVGALTNPTTRFVNNISLIAVAVFGATVGGLSAGELSAFIVYVNMFSRPLNEITAVATQIISAYAAAGRIFEIFNEQAEPDDSNKQEISRSQGNVCFENVSFSYDNSRPLIENLSIEVKEGMRVAIVGPTGAGKSTLVNLLMRFYDVDSGAIKIDGTDIRDFTRSSLRNQFGMVLQDTWIFKGTVMENLRYGNPDATDEQVIAAAKSAHAHSFICRMPKGYDTLIGDSSDLSAGQKQLLTIARAMVSDPHILILDEATSNIDTLTEQRVNRAFDKLMSDKTAFVIAHRLSTIVNSDIILVMDNGKIVEQGNHKQLLDKKGFYYKMYSTQFEN